MKIRNATRTVRTWHCDSRRWDALEHRAGDILVATFPKCGTTWTQRIVGMLLAQSAAPSPLMREQPWLDARFVPLADAVQALNAATARRGLKTHLPLDAIALHDDVHYIHVARDPRDACMSYHNHCTAFAEDLMRSFDQWGLEDETIAAPYPRPPADPRAFFRRFLRDPAFGPMDDYGLPEYVELEQSYWAERHRPNMLMVHYNDLKADLAGEMQRIADFLGIETPAALMQDLVQAAEFSAMKRDSAALLPDAANVFVGGGERFLHKGSNQRWLSVLTAEDLADCEAAVSAALSPALRAWAEGGRAAAGDPRTAPD